MAVKDLQNEEIYGGGKNRRKRANRGGAYTLRNESEEELCSEMLTPTYLE